MVTTVYNIWYGSYARLCRQTGRPLDRIEAAAAWRAVKASPIELSKWRRLADIGSANAEPKSKKRKCKAKEVSEGSSQPGASKKQSRKKTATMQDDLSRVAAPAVYLRPAYKPEPSITVPNPVRMIKPLPMRHRSPDDHTILPISCLLRGKLRHTEPPERAGSTMQGTKADDNSNRDTSPATEPILPPSLEDSFEVPPPAWSLEQYIHEEYLMW